MPLQDSKRLKAQCRLVELLLTLYTTQDGRQKQVLPLFTVLVVVEVTTWLVLTSFMRMDMLNG